MNKLLSLSGYFVKKDAINIRTGILILSALLAGGTVMVANNVLEHQFSNNMIYYTYGYIAQYFLLYFSVSYWGIEFQKKTINMLITSGRSSISLYIAKMNAYIIHTLIFFVFAFLEVAIYVVAIGARDSLFKIFSSLLVTYLAYGAFVFSCSSLLVIVTKKFVISLVGVWMLMSVFPAVSVLVQNYSVGAYMRLIPFSFIIEAFNFNCFTREQIVITLIWIVVLFLGGIFIFKKRGRV